MTAFSSWNSLCRADVTWECETMVILSTTHLLTSAQKTALKPCFDVWKAVALQFYILHSNNCYVFNGQVIFNFIQGYITRFKTNFQFPIHRLKLVEIDTNLNNYGKIFYKLRLKFEISINKSNLSKCSLANFY